MTSQIARSGRTITVEVPEELLKKANLAVGDDVEWVITPTGSLAMRGARHAEAETAAADYETWKQEEINSGLTELDSGNDVSNEKVVEWLRSWGTSNELPPPL